MTGAATAPGIAESIVEEATLAWLRELGYTVVFGPAIACGEAAAERSDPGCRDVILESRLRAALTRLNPDLPHSALEDAFRRLLSVDGSTLITRNHVLHSMLVNGVTVEYTCSQPDSAPMIAGAQVQVLDYEHPEQNDWLAVNQFTVVDGQHQRRPDVIVFVNGLPLAVIELKNPADENATLDAAFRQLQTYKAEIPNLFDYNVALVTSDGLQARVGSLSATVERFMPWRSIEGEVLAPASEPQLKVLLRGLFDQRRFLQFLRHFVVFEDAGAGQLTKKIAAYHQFHAVNRAVESTITVTCPLFPHS